MGVLWVKNLRGGCIEAYEDFIRLVPVLQLSAVRAESVSRMTMLHLPLNSDITSPVLQFPYPPTQ